MKIQIEKDVNCMNIMIIYRNTNSRGETNFMGKKHKSKPRRGKES